GVDQLVLGHARPALDVELGGPLAQLVDRPVPVVGGLTALLTHVGARGVVRGVRDARGLLLAGTVLTELFVELRVLDGRAVVAALGHGSPPRGLPGSAVRRCSDIRTRPASGTCRTRRSRSTQDD